MRWIYEGARALGLAVSTLFSVVTLVPLFALLWIATRGLSWISESITAYDRGHR